MMAWEHSVNRELGDLNDAHSAARIDTPEYRRRRRALLNDMLRHEGIASHTLRRPAGSAGVRAGGASSARSLTTRHASVAPRRSRRFLWWSLGVAAFSGATVLWMAIWPPF